MHVQAKAIYTTTSKTGTLLISVGVVATAIYVAYYGITWAISAPDALDIRTIDSLVGSFHPLSQV